MTTTTQDFEMIAGKSKTLNYTITDSAGAAQNLTAKTLTFRMALAPGGAAVVTKTIGSGITVTDAVNGLLTVTLAAEDVDNHGLHYHALEMSGGGTAVDVAKGRAVVRPTPG